MFINPDSTKELWRYWNCSKPERVSWNCLRSGFSLKQKEDESVSKIIHYANYFRGFPFSSMMPCSKSTARIYSFLSKFFTFSWAISSSWLKNLSSSFSSSEICVTSFISSFSSSTSCFQSPLLPDPFNRKWVLPFYAIDLD